MVTLSGKCKVPDRLAAAAHCLDQYLHCTLYVKVVGDFHEELDDGRPT